ncbi:MAG: DUF2752 domain-containing protein [Acidobacteriota bacterium]|nr:DUF2752 domain-containing protein [Acidobacteriota bacterium]
MLAFLGAAFVLRPSSRPDLPPMVAGMPLPPLCGFKLSTGFPCPGCGLTRSWVHAAHGDFQGSMAYHHLGWLAMLYAALQALRHGLWLARPDLRANVDKYGRYLDLALIGLAVLLALDWAGMAVGIIPKTLTWP